MRDYYIKNGTSPSQSLDICLGKWLSEQLQLVNHCQLAEGGLSEIGQEDVIAGVGGGSSNCMR